MVKYLPTACAVLLGLVCIGAATSTPSKLACDRTTCTYNDATFRVADVREVRFVDGFGKNRTRAESQIIFANGRQLAVGRASTEDARVTYHELRTFFSPDGPATLTMTGSAMTWMWLVVAGCAIAAVVLGLKAKNQRETYRAPEQKRADWKKRKKYILAGVGFVVVIGVVQLAILFVASKVQGTLVLECKQRCRFQGLECLPGGSSRQSLDEGTYTIEVWASSGSALWIPKQLAITTGETTTYVCQ